MATPRTYSSRTSKRALLLGVAIAATGATGCDYASVLSSIGQYAGIVSQASGLVSQSGVLGTQGSQTAAQVSQLSGAVAGGTGSVTGGTGTGTTSLGTGSGTTSQVFGTGANQTSTAATTAANAASGSATSSQFQPVDTSATAIPANTGLSTGTNNSLASNGGGANTSGVDVLTGASSGSFPIS